MCLTDENIAVNIDNLCDVIDLSGVFGRANPVHIEVGSGKGTFLLNQARQHSELNYLGIEWANKYFRYSVDRMRRWQVDNVRILRADARDFIRLCLVDESIAGFHVYFPDPWPKKRHHKRRFFQPDNVRQVARCLVRGGELRTATDHSEYFEIIRDLLLDRDGTAQLFEQIDFYPVDTANPGEWIGSNFERKYLKEGRPVYTLAVRKL